MSFNDFFSAATNGREPYPYQKRFATAPDLPHLIRAPTGAGKTATAILGWLWRWVSEVPNTPRRLAYCLPMRVLVEQSLRESENWINNLTGTKWLGDSISVYVLMGGVESEEWYYQPEKPAVLIGTQDMLLSRALNRGYAASRFHWPIDFGLLNNDCLWVFDEPQLMGSGVSTSAQLAGLRKSLGSFGSCPSVWMSATLEPNWLDTVDFRGKFPSESLELTDEDYDPSRPLHRRMTASKTLEPLGVTSTKDMKDVAKAIISKHQKATQTLVVLNTVDRAKAVYKELEKKKKKEGYKLLLVHSRFRAYEREALNEELQEGGEKAKNRIIVATQVVEAGVDISARTLITELAPWSSIVQRIGRCNRTGDDGPGQVFWIDLNTEKMAPPYEAETLNFARKHLESLTGQDVSPKALDDYKTQNEIRLPFEHQHVLRRRDLLDLFDTTPDLSGNDIDIQRFVRGDDPETDVQVFWRDLTVEDWNVAPHREELCSVPIGEIKALLKKDNVNGYFWDHLDAEWRLVRVPDRDIRPGLTILLPIIAGGYSIRGWDPDSQEQVPPVPVERGLPPESSDGDPHSCGPEFTISEHTQHVCEELIAILQPLNDQVSGWEVHLNKAARWHDVGKAHDAFQHGLRTANPELDPTRLWAKSGTTRPLRHGRKYFRHELASALTVLQNQQDWRFEIAYLIASHHGKVRLTIRPLPEEELPDTPDTLFALGVHHNDQLPKVELGEGEICPSTTLDLSVMRLGDESSWTNRALKLVEEWGPFRLAYMESLLRGADVRASQKEATND